MTISDEVFKTLFKPLIDENEEENLDDDIYVDQDNDEENEEYYDEYENENEEYYVVDDDVIDSLDTLIENLHAMKIIVTDSDYRYTEDQISNINIHIQNLEHEYRLLDRIVEDYIYID